MLKGSPARGKQATTEQGTRIHPSPVEPGYLFRHPLPDASTRHNCRCSRTLNMSWTVRSAPMIPELRRIRFISSMMYRTDNRS